MDRASWWNQMLMFAKKDDQKTVTGSFLTINHWEDQPWQFPSAWRDVKAPLKTPAEGDPVGRDPLSATHGNGDSPFIE